MKVVHFNKRMKSKLVIAYFFIIICLVGVIGHMFYISLVDGDDYEIVVLSQQDKTSTTLPFKRGDILDRNGNVLATSNKVYNLIIDPKIILTDEGKKYLEPTVNALVSCFELNRDELISKINEKKDSSYVKLIEKLTYEQIEGFKALQADTKNNPDIKGVWFEDQYERNYPYSTLGASTVGFTYSGNVGACGIEEYYNDELNGVDGRKYGFVNEDNTMENIIREAKDGNNVISTIDINIQKIVEEKVQSWKTQYTPENVAVVVANPNNGEILAMASTKNVFDLNNVKNLEPYYTEEELNNFLAEATKYYSDEKKASLTPEDIELLKLNRVWKNYCISDTYEAGSTIKPFTVAAALEEGVIQKEQTFICDGVQMVGGWPIHCHKRAGHGPVTVSQAIMYSCNDALMQIAALLGKDSFCDYQSRFGFGLKTGIDLGGEASADGLLYTADTMYDSALATNSFGQNFNVTMIQMVAGFSALINGGNYYQPHVVRQVVNSDGAIVENKTKTLIKEVITKDTSDFLQDALRRTVTEGTAKTAAVPGYEVAGKTGTAQINGRRGEDVYILSFMGYVPYNDPQVVCYVIVDQPQVPDPSSSSYASRLFSEIMTEVLPYMDIFPTIDSEVVTPEPATNAPQETTAQPENGGESGETKAQENTQQETTQAADFSNDTYEEPLYGEPEAGAENIETQAVATTE